MSEEDDWRAEYEDENDRDADYFDRVTDEEQQRQEERLEQEERDREDREEDQ